MSRAPASLFRGFSLLTIGNLGASATGFLAVVLIVEHFGAQGLGHITLATSVVGYALILGTCGTQMHAVRRVAPSPADLAPTAGTVLSVRLAAGTAAYLLLLAVASLVPRLTEIRPLIALWGLIILINAFNVSWVPQALNRPAVLAATLLGAQLFYLFGVWRTVASELDLTAVALSKVAADGIVALVLFAWMWKRFGPIRLPRSPRVVWRMTVDAAPMAATKFVRGAAIGSDVLVVGLMLSPEDLGHYAGAVRLFMFLTSLAGAYFVVLLPRLAQRRAEAGRALAVEVASSLRRVLLVATAVVAPAAWLARPLLSLLFGSTFGVATAALRLLLLALLANLVGRHFSQVLLVSDRQVLALRLSALAAGVHVVLKVAFVRLFGFTGAALGAFVGEATLMALLWWAARPELAPRRQSAGTESIE